MESSQLKWQPMKKAARDSDKIDPVINELAFNLSNINNSGGRTLTNGDFVVVRLKQINDGQFELLDKEQQASLAQQIEASYGEMDYDLYVNNLLAKAKIEK
jgi:peptidyl-prolyl cis-trans isomerase D